MWSNFHTHTHYCDGKGAVTDYLDACQKSRVAQVGFSSHAPLPFPCVWCMETEAFPAYLEEIKRAKSQYPEIEIYSGLEVDYIPGVVDPRDFAGKLDYTIGSIHFVGSYENKRWEIDNTREVFREGLTRLFANDIRSAVAEYYALTREMVANSRPDIVGHLDKIKINAAGSFFEESEAWYIDHVQETLIEIARSRAIVEVNTRGLYKKKSETTYPSPWILERVLDLDIPVTLSSDAHHPDDITREFDATLGLLNDIGFKRISVLKRGIWEQIPLTEYGAGS